MGDFKGMLKGMKKNWSGSQNQYDSMFGGMKIPVGTYLARITKAYGKTSKQDRPMVAREFVIAEGEFKGVTVFDNIVLDTDLGFVFLRKFVDSVGYECPEDVDGIPEILDAIAKEKPLVRIAVKHSGDFINVNISELVEGGGPASSDDEPAGEDEPEGDEPEGDDEPEGEDDALDLDNMTRAELKALITEKGLDITVTKKMTDDDIRAAITEAMGEPAADEPEPEDDEPEPEPEPEPKTPAKKAVSKKAGGNSPDVKPLLKFAQSQDLQLDAEDYDSVKETISAYEFNEDELTAAEIKLLTEHGLEASILKKKPAAKGKK